MAADESVELSVDAHAAGRVSGAESIGKSRKQTQLLRMRQWV